MVELVRHVVKQIKQLAQNAKDGFPRMYEMERPADDSMKRLITLFTKKSPDADIILRAAWVDFLSVMKEVHAMTQNDEEGDDEPGSDNQKQQLIAHLDQAVNAVALEIRKFVMNYKEKEKERFASFRKTPSASATPLPTTPKKSEEPQSQIITDVNKRHTVKNLTEFLPHRPSKTELIERKILHPEKKPQPTTSSALRPTIVAKKQPPLPPGAPASPSIGLQRSPSTDGSPMPRTASSDGTASPSSVIRADAGRSPSVLNYGTLRGMGANRSSRASVDVSADASDTFMLKGELVRLKVGNVYFKHRDQGHVTWKRGRLIITNFQLLFTSDANRVLVSVSLGSISTVQKLGGKTGDALQDLAGNAAYKIIVELKNFQKIHFNFERDKVQKSRKQVYETLKSLGELPPEKCFAFSFKETYRVNGWDVYMPEKEYERMGISLNPLPGQLWRLTYANRQVLQLEFNLNFHLENQLEYYFNSTIVSTQIFVSNRPNKKKST
eukprot:TRINITY_DN3751_c0_g1_i4.p1 TRINITY_DN3751_c0_g1~~TRINITY_DN3751_c0_g1_i4.p1  ORF type:complete len:521 (-),score=167.87 TRINITY_DN3751_c0_g1_i4:52-1539(-)